MSLVPIENSVGDGDYWVSLPYATFGITIAMGKVTHSAPIGQWAIGKTGDEFRSWVEKKGGDLDGPSWRNN